MFMLHLSAPLRGSSDVRRRGCDIEDAVRAFGERHPDSTEVSDRPAEEHDLHWPDTDDWDDVMAFELLLDEETADELVADIPQVVRDVSTLVLGEADVEPDQEAAFAARHGLRTRP